MLNKQKRYKKEAGAMTMDARKQRVLQAIVALYGLEGEPVGSSVLANYFDMHENTRYKSCIYIDYNINSTKVNC